MNNILDNSKYWKLFRNFCCYESGPWVAPLTQYIELLPCHTLRKCHAKKSDIRKMATWLKSGHVDENSRLNWFSQLTRWNGGDDFSLFIFENFFYSTRTEFQHHFEESNKFSKNKSNSVHGSSQSISSVNLVQKMNRWPCTTCGPRIQSGLSEYLLSRKSNLNCFL